MLGRELLKGRNLHWGIEVSGEKKKNMEEVIEFSVC